MCIGERKADGSHLLEKWILAWKEDWTLRCSVLRPSTIPHNANRLAVSCVGKLRCNAKRSNQLLDPYADEPPNPLQVNVIHDQAASRPRGAKARGARFMASITRTTGPSRSRPARRTEGRLRPARSGWVSRSPRTSATATPTTNSSVRAGLPIRSSNSREEEKTTRFFLDWWSGLVRTVCAGMKLRKRPIIQPTVPAQMAARKRIGAGRDPTMGSSYGVCPHERPPPACRTYQSPVTRVSRETLRFRKGPPASQRPHLETESPTVSRETSPRARVASPPQPLAAQPPGEGY